MSILVVGSAALDSVKTPYGEVHDALGGSALYFAAAAGFFSPVKVVAVVGDDFPHRELDFFVRHGVDLSGLEVARGETFRWSGIYHQDINQRDTVYTKLNVFETFSPKLPPEHRKVPYLFLANIHPELQLQVLRQMEKPRRVMLDTMNLWIDTALPDLKKVLSQVDAVILNDQEAKQLTGESNGIKAAKSVAALGPRIVIVKKGEHGAFLIMGEHFFAVPAYPLESLFDPTGAGDSFAGGLFGYLAAKRRFDFASLRKAMAYGTTIASFSVEEFSLNRLKRLTREEIEARLVKFKSYTRF